MGKCTFYRTRTINLKPILEELESEFKYLLILNSACENMLDVIKEDSGDYDVICGKIKLLWDLNFIDENEYSAIREHFSDMLRESERKTRIMKGGKHEAS